MTEEGGPRDDRALARPYRDITSAGVASRLLLATFMTLASAFCWGGTFVAALAMALSGTGAGVSDSALWMWMLFVPFGVAMLWRWLVPPAIASPWMVALGIVIGGAAGLYAAPSWVTGRHGHSGERTLAPIVGAYAGALLGACVPRRSARATSDTMSK